MINLEKILAYSLLLFLSLSCQDNIPKNQQILFIGHAYDWGDRTKIDPRLEQLNWANYEQIWLGGDVLSHTTESRSNLEYLDSIFDLDTPNLHWAWGNHDVLDGKPEYITAFTQKPSFYSHSFNQTCLIVLNTNLFHIYPSQPPQLDCDAKEAQLNLIQSVCDTINQSKNLVILHHMGLFNELKKDKEGQLLKDFNINPINLKPSCDSTSNFSQMVYPLLEEVVQRGVQVILAGGDLGMRAKKFEYQTEEGIWMLGSGINNSVSRDYAPDYVSNFDPDEVLIFETEESTGKLKWRFELLNDLIENKSPSNF